MANGDIDIPNLYDPVGDLERAAERLAALSPAVIAALGSAALHEGQSSELTERVKTAVAKMVQSLTEMTDTTVRPQAEAATDEMVVPPAVVHQPLPSQIAEPKPVATELAAQSMAARVDEILRSRQGSEINIGTVASILTNGSRLPSNEYAALIGVLNRNPHTTYHGFGNYEIGFMPEQEAVKKPSELVPEGWPVVAEETLEPSSETEDATEVAAEESDEDEEVDQAYEVTFADIEENVARWMGRRSLFTAPDLRDYLLDNEWVKPEEVAGPKINRLMQKLLPGIRTYYLEQGEDMTLYNDRQHPDVVSQLTDIHSSIARIYVPSFSPHVEHPRARPAVPVKQVQLETPQRAEVSSVPEPAMSQEAASTPELPAVISAQQPVPHRRERDISAEEIQTVVDVVAQLGGKVTLKSLVETLSDADEYGYTPEQVREQVQAAIAMGILFNKGVDGYKGVSLDPPSRMHPSVEVVDYLDPAYINAQVRMYSTVIEAVMDTLMALEPQQGLSYIKLWNRAKGSLGDNVDYEVFKEAVRNMKRDGLVAVLSNVRLHTKTADSKPIRGTRIQSSSIAVRTEWNGGRRDILNRTAAAERERLQSRKK